MRDTLGFPLFDTKPYGIGISEYMTAVDTAQMLKMLTLDAINCYVVGKSYSPLDTKTMVKTIHQNCHTLSCINV